MTYTITLAARPRNLASRPDDDPRRISPDDRAAIEELGARLDRAGIVLDRGVSAGGDWPRIVACALLAESKPSRHLGLGLVGFHSEHHLNDLVEAVIGDGEGARVLLIVEPDDLRTVFELLTRSGAQIGSGDVLVVEADDAATIRNRAAHETGRLAAPARPRAADSTPRPAGDPSHTGLLALAIATAATFAVIGPEILDLCNATLVFGDPDQRVGVAGPLAVIAVLGLVVAGAAGAALVGSPGSPEERPLPWGSVPLTRNALMVSWVAAAPLAFGLPCALLALVTVGVVAFLHARVLRGRRRMRTDH